MKPKYYTCKLETDIVLNASLATEGNMQTLDYIPGSKFWGIVASQKYKNLVQNNQHQKILDYFHNGNISFGNAFISANGELGYPLPFSLFQDKLSKEIIGADVYVHHALGQKKKIMSSKKIDGKESEIQLKQHRSGYLTRNNNYIKDVKKRFSLKSAQCRTNRKSMDGSIFGFESLGAGQIFIFSVFYSCLLYTSDAADE